MKGYRKVLIAVNGSLGPLKEGLKVADDERCWVTVLKVLPPYEGDIELTGIKDLRDVLNSGRQEIETGLAACAREERALAKVRVEEGDIPGTIKRVAEEEKCDLIIMGQRKVRGFFRRLFGDNASMKVVKDAPCPVLFVGQ